MYKFQAINSFEDDSYLSSVAMLFNGFYLEEKISGYQTLKVASREGIGYRIDSKNDISGRDGSIILGKTIPERLITVTYRITAKDSQEMQMKYRLLNLALHTNNEVPIKFNDDLDYTYYGQVQDFGEVTDESNTAISTFTILCSNPYKFRNEYSVKGNPVKIEQETFPTNPEEIKITLKENTNIIKLLNVRTGKKIILANEYKTNDVVKIQISKNKITVNDENRMQDLAFEETDFHEFKVKNGDEIQVTPNTAELEIKIRSKWK